MGNNGIKGICTCCLPIEDGEARRIQTGDSFYKIEKGNGTTKIFHYRIDPFGDVNLGDPEIQKFSEEIVNGGRYRRIKENREGIVPYTPNGNNP